MTRKGSQVQVLYGPPSEPLVRECSGRGLVSWAHHEGHRLGVPGPVGPVAPPRARIVAAAHDAPDTCHRVTGVTPSSWCTWRLVPARSTTPDTPRPRTEMLAAATRRAASPIRVRPPRWCARSVPGPSATRPRASALRRPAVVSEGRAHRASPPMGRPPQSSGRGGTRKRAGRSRRRRRR